MSDARSRSPRRTTASALGAALAFAALSLGATPSLAAGEKRALPEYDGRERPTTLGDAVLVVPRVVLFPAYVVSEYLIRRPLGFVITEAERAGVPAALYDLFAFGPDHKAGIVPIAFVDFGFQPSVGLYSFWDDAGFTGHDLRLHGSTWGEHWLAGSATERFRLGHDRDLTLAVGLTRRPDYAYYGLGPDTVEGSLSRYGADTAVAGAAFHAGFWGTSSVSATLGYRGARFYAGEYRGRNVAEAVRDRLYPEPPGYADGYRAPTSAGRLVLDSRGRTAKSGVRLELEAEQGTNLAPHVPSGWLRYGGTVGGLVDLTRTGRVVSLSLSTELAEPLGSRPVPFDELVTLGGPALMPGFRAGRLHGESAVVGALRYTWPIWIWLDGSLQAAVGNVFGRQLAGASLDRSRFSGAIGIESQGSRDSIFQALVGFGTETFESGARVNSIRFTIGARSGF